MLERQDTLIGRAVGGDADALAALLEHHGPAVQQRLRIGRQWRAALEPDDVMQVTYLEAFMQIGRFDPSRPDAFEAWLRRIAENNLRDALRGLKRQKRPQPANQLRPHGGDDSAVALLELIGATSATPSRELRRDETHALLDRAIRTLPEDYAAVIQGYDLQGRGIADLASELGRSPGAVHMLRARAHDRLRELLGTASMFFSAHG
jgi:RNA polymerase sigma-70 factor, ECF subfamily